MVQDLQAGIRAQITAGVLPVPIHPDPTPQAAARVASNGIEESSHGS